MSKKKTKTSKILITLLLLIVTLALGSFVGFKSLTAPKSEVSVPVNFIVRPNDNLTTISNNLESQEIIKSALATKLAGKISGVNNFVEGAFSLDKAWNSDEILVYLTNPANVISNEVSVTLQEGLWAKHMAEKIAASVDVTSDELLELWSSEEYLRSLMATYPFLSEDIFNENLTVNLEGYLAPNTYNFYIDSSADVITKKLLDQTLKIYNTYIDEFMASDYSVHQLFTLASLTQYESGNFEDDKIIAGVWYNRLDIGMRLESSVTVCYALYDYDSFEECEKNTDIISPYNTYRNNGIPPGPVTNPGETSILATLRPEKTDYLFFLADVYNDGKIYYSETFAEHAEKVNKYLR